MRNARTTLGLVLGTALVGAALLTGCGAQGQGSDEAATKQETQATQGSQGSSDKAKEASGGEAKVDAAAIDQASAGTDAAAVSEAQSEATAETDYVDPSYGAEDDGGEFYYEAEESYGYESAPAPEPEPTPEPAPAPEPESAPAQSEDSCLGDAIVLR